jgi:hypothetical protein
MNKATQTSASALGIYAGLLGIEHGFFEFLQGDVPTKGILIHAMGPTCHPEAFWHACFPALTLLPNFQVTGLLAIIIGLSVLIWAAGFIHRKHGGLILILLSALMLPVGGGFVPVFVGITAGLAGTRIHASLNGWQRLPENLIETLSKLWPWILILLLVWFPTSWIVGYFFNQIMLNLGVLPFFFFDIGLPILIVCSATSFDNLSKNWLKMSDPKGI